VLDDVFDVLSHTTRRRIVLRLYRKEGNDGVRLSEVVADHPRDRARVEVGLVHSHLPRLEENGFIEWDRPAGRIQKGPHFDALEPVVAAIERSEEELGSEWP
jgi:hypothetical protein